MSALQRAEYRVAGPFGDCSDASDWLATAKPDGAFLNISLSNPTCFALATELRQRGVPFVFHSGWGSLGGDVGGVSPLTTLLNAMTKLIQKTLNGGAQPLEREKTAMLRVGIVDDHPAVSNALTTLFEMAGFEVCTFLSSDDFLLAAKHIKLDCVLLDGSISALSEHAVLAALGAAGDPLPVLIISERRDISFAVAIIKAGAYDFIEKPFDGEVVVERVREAVRNWAPAQSIKSWLRIPQAAGLTPREVEVLEQIAGGASNKVAGQILTMSPRTVEVHRARLMDKLGARNTADLRRIVVPARHHARQPRLVVHSRLAKSSPCVRVASDRCDRLLLHGGVDDDLGEVGRLGGAGAGRDGQALLQERHQPLLAHALAPAVSEERSNGSR